MKRHWVICMVAAFFAVLTSGESVVAGAVEGTRLLKMDTHIVMEAEALQREFSGRHDYNALMARKLADVVLEEMSQWDVIAVRQFLLMAKEYAIKARKAQ